MRHNLFPASMLLASLLLAACAGTAPVAETDAVPEIHPGVLQGYLPLDTPLRSVEVVPPAPQAGSARQALDEALAARALTLRNTPRWELARQDAQLRFPEAEGTFSCATGLPISEQVTPRLYMLLRRTVADLAFAANSAKNAYQRPRPFMVNNQPICSPEDETSLRENGSYPSGHTAIGWGWALILAELIPENAEAILARGRAFGESRSVCNVHWHSDIVAGRMIGAAALASLHGNAAFATAMAGAREELAALDRTNLTPSRDCAAEASALAQTYFSE
ncbi:acid phosphatase [Pseudohalioglobus sediminis]|nr:phosphatase PAP2 family protein [Pseudohalioglobus sediminis]